ncbi:hypothetical protein ACFXJ8_43785 [Nonomuraea sp. NPDC059194]|uniref:hypothetical protein n=1 Tax=Nonomuraea sp. NPDC059194 TaxID=3346764 RepID=UPI003680B986
MPIISISMHRPDRSIVNLRDIIELLPQNSWTWNVRHFEGIGVAPQGMHMADFDLLTASEEGYSMTWGELLEFSSNMEQVIDCVITARTSNDARPSSTQPTSALLARIEAFDSTEWIIELHGPLADNSSLAESLARL